MASDVRVRFAPSPTGKLHIGGARTAIYNWAFARANGGTFILRIDDTDPTRSTDENTQIILRAMRWLGLDWDIGPGKEAGTGPYYQSQRTEIYQAALETLREKGLVYPCFCTRAELHAASAPHREDGQVVYAGTCRRLTAAEIVEKSRNRAPALRLITPEEHWGFTDGHMGRYEENLAADCGDFLLRRSDGMFAYQLAVVVDDAAMGVTEVVRGADLLDSTPRQMYLYYLLGLTPPVFYHFPLLLTAEGNRLSKRDGAVGLDSLQTKLPPEEILGRLAFLAGFNPAAAPKTADEPELFADAEMRIAPAAERA